MNAEALPSTLLSRKAIVYVRQSTQTQVQTNLESKRRQYVWSRLPGYLRHVLERIADQPVNRIDELLPWRVDLQSDLENRLAA